MHKRRQRGLTARDIEEVKWALQYGDWESLEGVTARMERRAKWDEQHPTGEGSAVEQKRILRDGRYQWVDDPCTYQWVRVTDEKNKVLGTFYIRHHDGDISELFIAPARKGVRPNPYDRGEMSNVSWKKDSSYEYEQDHREEMARRAAMTPAERERHMNAELERNRDELERRRVRAESDPRYAEYYPDDVKYLSGEAERIRGSWDGDPRTETRPLSTDGKAILGSTGLSEAHKVKGQRPTLGVQPVTDLDGDVRFAFRDGKNGFSVRGSLLGPVLLQFRQHGLQSVSLSMVRAGVQAVVRGHG